MTANQFNAALRKLGFCTPQPNGLTSKGQSEFAALLELSNRNVRRWAAGERPVPTSVAMLLNLMLKTDSTAKDLKR
jgi:succinate dehydrogenase flavin-adding protein (antitoxin of CptAB toxin-antitoxin module)